jgi:hypothetical protein
MHPKSKERKTSKSKSGSRVGSVGNKRPEMNSISSLSGLYSMRRSRGYLKDARYAVFTTLERSNKVVLSETPLSGRILNEHFGETKDLQHFL